MIEPEVIQGIIKILLVCVIITAAYIISTRNLLSLVSMYSLQSVTLVFLALALWVLEPAPVLLGIAVVTFLSKALIIPYFIAAIQEKIRIKRDIEFHFLSPTTSLILSMSLMLVVYMALTRVLQGTPARENHLFFFGAVIGLSLMLMGMMVMLEPEEGDHQSPRLPDHGKRRTPLRYVCYGTPVHHRIPDHHRPDHPCTPDHDPDRRDRFYP